jgi:molybdopterin molybdotransferase
MIDLDDLLQQVWPLAQAPVQTDMVGLNDALGGVLAKDIYSTINVPQHDNSGMDGYAVRVGELSMGQAYVVSQRVPAGSSPCALQAGTVARIFTGAPIPAGADAVIMQEEATVHDNATVSFVNKPQMNQFIRKAGEDIAAGQVVLSRGTVLDAVHTGLLASIGIAQVPVFPRLKVGVMVTGSELCNPGQALAAGQIYNSNEFVWCGLLAQLGIEVQSVGIVADDFEATCQALASLASCDAIVSSGGVSVGEEDHVKPALERVGTLRSWKVAMKPGKPIAFGHIEKPSGDGVCWFFGLPGNPVSSAVAFQLIVKPFLAALQGQVNIDWRKRMRKVSADFSWSKPDLRREEFLRVDVQSNRACLFTNQSSGVLTSLAQSSGLVRLPKGAVVNPGDELDYVSYQELMR